MLSATVAIVGGGPVGLLLACELGLRGISTIVLNDGTATSTHPKANTHTARSMEIYRRHGISAELRARGLSKEQRTDVAYYTRLLGHELHRVSLPTPAGAIEETRRPHTRWPTPEPQFRTSQLMLEPVLLERARQFPSVDVRFGRRVTALADDGNGVMLEAEAADGGREIVRAAYAVGCDGGRSFVRNAIGERLQGEGGVDLTFMGGRMEATYFRAPGLQRRLRHPHAWQNWILLPHLRALLLALDAERDLYLMHYQFPADPNDAKPFADVLGEVVGEPTPCEVISAAEWRAGVSLVAKRFRRGRCFLAGDAAHLFTPTGGFGLNTGIEDAVNLAWKIAAVEAGWAPLALLESYESERQPIAERNTAYALTLARRNGAAPVSADIEADTPAGDAARAAASAHLMQFARWEYDTPGIQLGVSYYGSAIVAADGAPAPPDSPIEYVPNAVPGSRLPHVWLSDGTSLYDRLGQEFTLIAFGDVDDAAPWMHAANARGIPLKLLHLPGAAELQALAGAAYLLVRPDQHIAWRGDAGDPDRIFDLVTGREPARLTAPISAPV